MKIKRVFTFLLSVILIISAVIFSFSAYADDTDWRFDSDSATLYITGTGAMNNFTTQQDIPWYTYLLMIHSVVIQDGITSIGSYAFSGAENLTKVDIPSSVTSVGEYAFASCSSLNELTFGKSITSISDSSFAYDGVSKKQHFVLNTQPGSYPQYFAVKNKIQFNCPSVNCSTYDVNISPKGMIAYYPYTAKVDGKFKFYSQGKHDTVGYLFDSSMNQIVYNDDYGNTTDFSLTADLKKGTTYYFAARILNSNLPGTFKVSIEPVTYSVSGTINAMLDKTGRASDILIDSALINNEATDGTFSLNIDETNDTAVFSYKNASVTHTFSPDDGDNIAISLMVCDMNDDGVVNAKDFAYMNNTRSPYKKLFRNFMNYRIE